MSKDWNVDAYKNEHESLEHWELRKKFLLTYKDKFPEDELICLAQVFANIEFLGCRYFSRKLNEKYLMCPNTSKTEIIFLQVS